MAKENDGQFTQISSSMTITGDLEGSSDLRIAGKVKGNISTSSDVVVEKTGHIEGTIKAKNTMIAGNINGDIECSEKLVLESSSSMAGNIHTKLLIIESGAKLKGNCEVGPDRAEIKKP